MRDKQSIPVAKANYQSKYTGTVSYGTSSRTINRIKIQNQKETGCFDYTPSDIQCLEETLFALNHQSVKFLHNIDCAYGAFSSIESQIKIGPVALLQKGGDQQFYGVYAKTNLDFPMNLGEYLGEARSTRDTQKNSNLLYSFDLGNGTEINAKYQRSWHAMVNGASSDENANLRVSLTHGKIYYHLKRTIKAEEQLLVYYGDDYRFVDKRFLNANDNWEESSQKFERNRTFYNIDQVLDNEILKLFKLRDMLFAIPAAELVLESHLVDLPILAYTATLDHLLPQNQQENPTLLHMACWQGNSSLVAQLLQQGANPNQQTSITGFCPLHLIVLSQNSFEQKKKLIDLIMSAPNATLRLQDIQDRSILHIAIETGQVDLVSHLLAFDKKRNGRLNIEKSLKACVNEKMQCYLLLSIEMRNIGILRIVESYILIDEIKYYLNHPEYSKTLAESFIGAYKKSTNSEWDEMKECILSFAKNCEKTKDQLALLMFTCDQEFDSARFNYEPGVEPDDAKEESFQSVLNQLTWFKTSSSMVQKLEICPPDRVRLIQAANQRPVYDGEFEDDLLQHALENEAVNVIINQSKISCSHSFFNAVQSNHVCLFRKNRVVFEMARANIRVLHEAVKQLNCISHPQCSMILQAYTELHKLIMISSYYFSFNHERRQLFIMAPQLQAAIQIYWTYAFIHAVTVKDVQLFIMNEGLKQKLQQGLLFNDNNIQQMTDVLTDYAKNNVHFVNAPFALARLKSDLFDGLEYLQQVYHGESVHVQLGK